MLLDELAEVFELDLANLALIEDGGRRARVVAARDGGRDNERLVGQELDLENEPSGISTVTREGAAFAVFDAESSPIVNQRLNQLARVKSCAFVPMLAGGEVVGVVFAAVRRPRLFGDDELAQMQALAAEAGLALARTRASAALAEALERERLIAHISREVRSLRDLDELLRVAVEETAKGIRADRCFIRLGEPGEQAPLSAEWVAAGVAPLEDLTRLPVVNLAAREQRTLAVSDVLEAPELSDATLGHVRELAERGVRAVLATPIVSFGRVIGVLALHRAEPTTWLPTEISLAEAIAHETAIAIDTSRLLRESTRQAQVERGFYRIAAVLSEPLSAEATHDAVAQAAAEALGGDSAAVLRAVAGRARAGRLARARRRARRLPPGGRGRADGVRSRRQAARVAPAGRRRPLRRGARPRGGGGRTGARCSPYRCRSRRAAASGSCSSSSRPRRCSTTSSSRWPSRSPARRAAPWSEASCTSASAAPGRWRSGSPGPGGSSPASSIPTTCSTRPSATPCSCVGAEGASIRMLEDDEVVVRAATGAGEDEAIGTRAPSTGFLVGDIVQTRSTRAVADVRTDRRLGEADPMLAAGYLAYLGVPMIGPEESVQGILAVYDGADARVARGGRSRRCTRSAPAPPRPARTPSSTRASATSSSAARRSSRTSPTGSSRSTARARSCSGTPPPSA